MLDNQEWNPGLEEIIEAEDTIEFDENETLSFDYF